MSNRQNTSDKPNPPERRWLSPRRGAQPSLAMSSEAEKKEAVLADYRKKLLKHKEIDTKVRSLREAVKELKKDYDKTEDDLKALQSVGQIIGEVLRQLDEERCESVIPSPRLTRAVR